MYTKARCTCKVVVLLIKRIVFLTFSLLSASLELIVPNSYENDQLGSSNGFDQIRQIR